MTPQEQIEDRVEEAIRSIEKEFAALGGEAKGSVARALIHRAVHHAAATGGLEYCALATYLAEMIGHAHQLAHGDNPRAHRDVVH
jgi:hypothetical protein